MNSTGPLSVYIHIPYCLSKCYYCDFASYAGMEATIPAYFAALEKEICNSEAASDKRQTDTVYIGGGTPSFVCEEYIAHTLEVLGEVFDIADGCEVSIESNPNSLTYEKCLCYKKAGINRISLGAQAIQDDLLKRIGRSHGFKDIKNAVDFIKRAGIENFNIDLMAALPGQSAEDFEKSLVFCAESGASHISAYSLIVEEGTSFYGKYASGEYVQDDELEREMYYAAQRILSEYGFSRYEISNYAKPGYECRHNMNCWNFYDYVGFGAAACGFYGGRRINNESDINEYIKRTEKGVFKQSGANVLINSERTLQGEYMMLGLRKIEGADVNGFYEMFETYPEEAFRGVSEGFEKEGLISLGGGHIALTQRGLDYASYVMRGYLD